MPDILKVPCKRENCGLASARLVIDGALVYFSWEAEHRRHAHPNSIDLVVLLRLLASQKPELLRSILERAA
jgi:hypothetical protein